MLGKLHLPRAARQVIGIRDIRVNNYRDTGYLGKKLYRDTENSKTRFWYIEDRSSQF